ncbi:cytochrome c oxidase assembly factor 5 [Euwallacea similis]|uniref:cytochrome c oxidase assembly factor 5 n=1 Tax=Euwallacea similis TaxID=1736056 RepID=UPI00344FA175
MMKFTEENETLKDKSACAGVRADLKMCLLQSECCQIHRKSPKECLNVTDGSVPSDCFALRTTFFECKRSLLDARQRFRGRKGY